MRLTDRRRERRVAGGVTLRYNIDMPTALHSTTFRLEANLLAGLRHVRVRDGIPVTEQVRRAVLAWLKARDVDVELNPTNGRRRRHGRSKP